MRPFKDPALLFSLQVYMLLRVALSAIAALVRGFYPCGGRIQTLGDRPSGDSEVYVWAEGTKPYGLESWPPRSSAFSARGFSPVLNEQLCTPLGNLSPGREDA